MTIYTVVTGDGNELCSGVSEYEIERVAQAWADRLAETVYYSSGADLDPEDDDDIGTAVEPRTMRCQCGEYTGERCAWIGSPTETVVVEYMPEHLRASHEAAGNRGVYPHNGAARIRCERSCADRITHIWVGGEQTDEPDPWVGIVGE